MAVGFCFGRVLTLDPQARRSITLKLGLAMASGFVVIRALNFYGDPAPWAHQKSALFTVLSFVNCTKYPASLDFLLMTLGPGLLVLAYLDGHPLKRTNPLVVFGRVPFFYFIVHFYVIHSVLVLIAWVWYGRAAFGFMFNPVPSMGGPKQLFSANFGWSLAFVYAVWIVVVVLLYPLCKRFAEIKSTRRDWWLSYV